MQIVQTKLAELTAKQIKALPMLAAGMSATEVSKTIKISQIQLSQWRRNSKFMAALDNARRNALRESELALSSLALNAVQALKDSLDSASSEQTRLRAAIYIIDKLGLSACMESETTEVSGSVNMGLLFAALGVQQAG